jgi:hypothetical protein
MAAVNSKVLGINAIHHACEQAFANSLNKQPMMSDKTSAAASSPWQKWLFSAVQAAKRIGP